MTATAEQIEATIDSYVACFSAGDRDGYLRLWAPGATVEDPVGSEVAVDIDGIGAFWDGVRAMASEITLERTGAARIAAGEAAWPLRATTVVDGTALSVEIIDVMVFDDEGRITSLRAFWDPAEMAPVG